MSGNLSCHAVLESLESLNGMHSSPCSPLAQDAKQSHIPLVPSLSQDAKQSHIPLVPSLSHDGMLCGPLTERNIKPPGINICAILAVQQNHSAAIGYWGPTQGSRVRTPHTTNVAATRKYFFQHLLSFGTVHD
jgi:hypothetical protein